MGAEYSFGIDNNRLLKGFLRLRNGIVLLMVTTIIMIISGILYPIYLTTFDSDSIVITIWFFELITIVMMLIPTILIYSSIHIISKNINEKNGWLFKLSKALLLFFIISLSLSTIFILPLQWLDTHPIFSLIKNMIAYMFLTAFLIAFSFSFKNLQEIGYGTRLIYVPLIFLTVPSIVSFILGCICFSEPFNSNIDVYLFGCSLLNLYIVVFLFFSFLEIFLVFRRMTRLIDVQVNYVLKSPESELIAKSAVPAKK